MRFTDNRAPDNYLQGPLYHSTHYTIQGEEIRRVTTSLEQELDGYTSDKMNVQLRLWDELSGQSSSLCRIMDAKLYGIRSSQEHVAVSVDLCIYHLLWVINNKS